ncbi:putative leader peptide [Streptomyces sp. NPDC048290]
MQATVSISADLLLTARRHVDLGRVSSAVCR